MRATVDVVSRSYGRRFDRAVYRKGGRSPGANFDMRMRRRVAETLTLVLVTRDLHRGGPGAAVAEAERVVADELQEVMVRWGVRWCSRSGLVPAADGVRAHVRRDPALMTWQAVLRIDVWDVPAWVGASTREWFREQPVGHPLRLAAP